MPQDTRETDTTDSPYPDGQENHFDGRTSERERQHTSRDTTQETSRAEPATSDAGSSDPQEATEGDPEADTTAADQPDVDEAPSDEGEVDAETGEEPAGADAAGEEPVDAEREDAEPDAAEEGGAAGEEMPEERQWQFLGTPPEDLENGEEYADYAYISGYDPDQRYESEEDLVHAHEELLKHTDQQQEQVQTLQERLAEARAEKEGEVEELRTKVNMYEEQLGQDKMVDLMADRFMPEEYQGLSEEEVAEENKADYLKARGQAEMQAERRLEEAEEKREQATQQAKNRQEAINSRMDDAEEFFNETIDPMIKVDGENSGEYVEEAISRMTPDGEDAKNPLDLAYNLVLANEVTPDNELGFKAEEGERAARLIARGIQAEAEKVREERIQKRSSKVRKQTSKSAVRGSSGPTPEKSEGTEPGREPNDENPRATFRKA